jgi:hypothetical protein
MADKDFKVKTGLDLPAPLPASEGGTGQTSLANAINALLPDQTNNASKILGTNGSSLAWTNPGAAYQTSAPSNPVTGQLWVDSDETGDSLDPYIIRRKTITATAGQTVFTTDVVFTDGYEQIYYNGVLLVRTTDYTTSGGTNTVTLLQGASAGDTVEIISSTPINLVNTITTSGGTVTAPNASTIPLKIVGASSQSADLFEVLNSSSAELFAVRPNGRIKSSIISTEVDSTILGLHANANNGSSGTSVILWGKDMATWGGDVHYLADSRGASGAHRFWNWDGTNFLQRVAIDKNGNLGIGTDSPGAKLSVIGNALIAPTTTSSATTTYLDIRMTGTADGSPNAIRIGADASGGSFYGVAFIDTWRAGVAAATALSLRTEGTEKVKLGTGNDHVNMGFMRTWNIGQPTNMIVSGGTNCIRIWINKSTAQNYYRGFTFDVHGGGGYDWPGNGLATYFGKFMITFTGTDTGRLHLIQEYSRSYINNTGTEITYNTFSATSDSNYYYLTINFKGINASQGYRPLFSVITYDAGNGGSTSGTGSNNQVGWVSVL